MQLIIGTRGSKLAICQSETVSGLIKSRAKVSGVSLKVIKTLGDELSKDTSLYNKTKEELNTLPTEAGVKGLFTEALELELLAGRIHFAVHSLKDLPTNMKEDFTLAAVPKRDFPYDSFVSNKYASLMTLPSGAIVGTASARRQSIIKNLRPDLTVRELRGNVDTRLNKLDNGEVDALILAEAGLTRLNLEVRITERLDPTLFLPAPGQGALGIQCLSVDSQSITIAKLVTHPDTVKVVTAERAFIATLGASCGTPVAAYAHIEGDTLYLHTRCYSLCGLKFLETNMSTGKDEDPFFLGERAAKNAISKGAIELMRCS
jgi:hydroxymethylbilane synthase